MLVTLLPIVTLVKPEQYRKALYPMLVTLLGIVILVRAEQPEKAYFPMLVTLLGMVIVVSLYISLQQLEGMDSTSLPNTNDST